MKNIQSLADIEIKRMRDEEFANSPQLNLGELIQKIENCGLIADDGAFKAITYDFANIIPTTLDSWRGNYAELALGWTTDSNMTVDILLKELKSALDPDKYYQGWRGGNFKMDENTPVWVDNPGRYSRTAIVGVKDLGYEIIIITAHLDN